MKKIWKIMLAAGVMSLAASLCMGTAAFAATESGTIEGGFTWEADTDISAVTVTGSGQVTEAPWIDTVEFSGNDGINYIFGDGITEVSGIGYPTGSMEVGKDFQSLDTLKQASGPITISEDNPYFASYEGCVYSKDMSTLLYCPYGIEEPKLYPEVKTIAAGAFDGVLLVKNGLSRVVIPWGVTTIQDGAFSGIAGSSRDSHYVVLPNTITYMTENSLPGRVSGTGCMFIYQKDNQLVDNILKGKTDSHQTPMANPVNSISQYYPSQTVTPAQNGWVQENYHWYYYQNNAKQVDWQFVDGVWYYLGTDGVMQTGWITYNGSTYYLRPWGGMMVNGWYQIDSKWYYFQSWGGTAKSQWLYGLDKKWYYVDANGVMLTNTRTPDGYYVDANGVWVQ